MEKGKKLKVYSDKNYAEIIDFPVELIGRDGVVRRYSYEESMRIYRRRIESAHLRYQDRDIVTAEIFHCTRRLEQIERSWRERIASGEQDYIAHTPEASDREPFDRGKAFLNTYLANLLGERDRPLDASPSLLLLSDEQAVRVFYVSHFAFHPGTLLYTFSLKPGGDGVAGRKRYLDYVDVLQSTGAALETEKLVHHGIVGDYAFIVTCARTSPIIRAAAVGSGRVDDGGQVATPLSGSDTLMGLLEPLQAGAEDYMETPLEEVALALTAGHPDKAFSAVCRTLEENPWCRDAYGIVTALGSLLGRVAESEPYLEMGLHYFPQDLDIHLWLGLHELKLGKIRRAVVLFQTVESARPETPGLHRAQALGFLQLGNTAAALDVVQRGLAFFPEDLGLLSFADTLQRVEWTRRGLMLIVFVLTVGGLILGAGRVGPAFWVAVVDVIVAVVATVGFLTWRRWVLKKLV